MEATKQEKTIEEKKEHTRQYNKEYMKEYYRNKEGVAKKMKLCRLNGLIKKQYEIDEQTQKLFKNNLHTIVRIKELMDTLDDGVANAFLLHKHNIQMKKIIPDGRGLSSKKNKEENV